MKILILLSYFDRPKLVRNALNSILRCNEHHDDWELLFGDDGSSVPGDIIAREILGDFTHKITFVSSNTDLETKLNEGITIGRYANTAILNSDADIAVTLSDDDELTPTYLKDLSQFFDAHPEAMYCYSKVHLYNPLFEHSSNVNNVVGPYNSWNVPINPANKLDASQVAFKLDCFRLHGVRYLESTKDLAEMPWVKNLDGALFNRLYELYGDCPPTNLIAQYKGVHDYQMVWHKKNGVDALTRYIEMVQSLAGEVL